MSWFVLGAWVARVLLVAAIVERVVAGDGLGAAALGLFTVLSFVYVLADDDLPSVFDLLVALAALLNAFGFVFHLYKRIPYYDNLAHATTIFTLSLAFYFLIYRDSQARERRWVMALSVFTFGAALGELWEIVEWSAESILDTNVVFGLIDTETDLITNSTAALVAAVVGVVVRSTVHGRARRPAARHSS
ncbi:MAG: hypothetical protein ACTHNS_10640 [Marmoricola sp.]